MFPSEKEGRGNSNFNQLSNTNTMKNTALPSANQKTTHGEKGDI